MEGDEKPLKLGQLWMMTTSGFKKTFKSRFCILTNKVQLIWFKKQEVCFQNDIFRFFWI